MNTTSSQYSTLYSTQLTICVDKTIIKIPTSEIVSIAIVDEFDHMTHRMIRVRLYTDISNFEIMAEDPDNITVNLQLDGAIYQINSDGGLPSMVAPLSSVMPFGSCTMKAYIEQKNSPSSTMDQYVDGIKKEGDLNQNVKVPIELYCYNEDLIHKLKQRSTSVYSMMTLTSAIEQMFADANIYSYTMQPIDNPERYTQILIPNLNISDTLSYMDQYYGLYTGGGQLYCDMEQLMLCGIKSSTVKPQPIYVASAQSNKDSCGMIKTSNGSYSMSTLAGYVSVLSQSDIERVLNGETIVGVNLMDHNVDEATLKVYKENDDSLKKINTPNYLHKTQNKFPSSQQASRIDEQITRIDVSGSGFPIESFTPHSRFNLIFESAIRGINIDAYYRPSYVCHVLSILDSNLFIANTTMNLCVN